MQELSSVRAEIAELKKQVASLEGQLNLYKYLLKQKQDRTDELAVDVTAKGFLKLDTTNGPVLVSVQEVSPYLDGYKVKLELGNPTNATYTNFTIKAQWGRSYDWNKYTPDSHEKWEKSLHSKDIIYTEELKRGVWNKIDMILTPASANELEYLLISIDSKSVLLNSLP